MKIIALLSSTLRKVALVILITAVLRVKVHLHRAKVKPKLMFVVLSLMFFAFLRSQCFVLSYCTLACRADLYRDCVLVFGATNIV